MHKAISAAILALAISGAALATVGTASAAGVSVNVGGIAFGYQDGYWDHSHQWHQWRNQSDMRSYKTASGNQYHDWKHTRDKNQGWMQ